MELIDRKTVLGRLALELEVHQFEIAEEVIEKMPTIEERKTGRLEFMGDCWRCSVCGRFVYDNMTVDKDGKGYDFRLCPECGAKMEGAEK